MGRKLLVTDGKSISAWDVDSDVGWTTLGASDIRGIDLYFARVPWLYRGVMDRAENVGSMPFAIKKGETEFDGSADYQNKLEFLPNPGRMFRQIEQSLVMTGKAYLFKEANRFGYIKNLVYCNPNSVSEERDLGTNEITGYWRSVGTKRTLYPVAQFVAITVSDYLTEDGSPKTCAAQAALISAGVLYSTDKFITGYFDRGAIKATVLSVNGGTQAEAERLQDWWRNVVTGIKNAWSSFVMRGEAVKPTVIGEGLEGLQNNEITTERRQDIATALGVPESRLWSSAANYATRKEDEQAYYKSTIIPDCKTIADAINVQLFGEAPYKGLKLEFLTNTLEVFQEDVASQAQAAGQFIDFLTKCPTAEIAKATCVMMGFELDDEMLAAIDAWFAQKEEAAAEIQETMNQPAPVEDAPAVEDEPQEQEEPEANPQEMRSILKAWERKAKHAVKIGQSACVPFDTHIIPLALQGAIARQLEVAQTEGDVKRIFTSAWRVYP